MAQVLLAQMGFASLTVLFYNLSYDIPSGSDINPCNKRFTDFSNVMNHVNNVAYLVFGKMLTCLQKHYVI